MPKPESGQPAGDSFVGSVMKYSVATYLGFGITGLAIVLRGVLGPDKTAIPFYFMSLTATLMYMGILGLDQSLLRFFHQPPSGADGRDLYRACTLFSTGFMLAAGVVCSVFFAGPLAAALGFERRVMIPLLFLNAALYMTVRFLNVLLRLENDLRAYTAETLWMQACYSLIYLLPGLFTSAAWWFALASILGFGMVAVAYTVKAHRRHPHPGKPDYPAIYRTVLPYGLLLAPAPVLTYFNTTLSQSMILAYAGKTAQGVFGFGVTLAQLVTTVQAGFATYWGPYVFSHYRTEQERIARIHDFLNFLIFGFFCVLVMLEDVIFWVFPAYKACLPIFPLLMLNAVFTILCEGTVYGNSIARKPFHDTIGIALGAGGNLVLCGLLAPKMGLLGAALALAVSNGVMFLYRTLTGQYYYRTIPSYAKTISGFLLAFAVTAAGTLLAGNFWLKFFTAGAILFVYCSLYRTELHKLLKMANGYLLRFFHRA